MKRTETGSTARKPMKQSHCEGRPAASSRNAERGLPPSSINQDDYPLGPTGMARFLEDRIEELESQKCEAASRADRRPINKQMLVCRDLLKWVKSRDGYVLDV